MRARVIVFVVEVSLQSLKSNTLNSSSLITNPFNNFEFDAKFANELALATF